MGAGVEKGLEFLLNPDGTMPQNNCECCSSRYVGYTATASTHKWTKKEIEEEILYLSAELVSARWYNRGNIRRQLAHWVSKLNKYNEAEQEFKF